LVWWLLELLVGSNSHSALLPSAQQPCKSQKGLASSLKRLLYAN
jgi:hypothetical protein